MSGRLFCNSYIKTVAEQLQYYIGAILDNVRNTFVTEFHNVYITLLFIQNFNIF